MSNENFRISSFFCQMWKREIISFLKSDAQAVPLIVQIIRFLHLVSSCSIPTEKHYILKVERGSEPRVCSCNVYKIIVGRWSRKNLRAISLQSLALVSIIQGLWNPMIISFHRDYCCLSFSSVMRRRVKQDQKITSSGSVLS